MNDKKLMSGTKLLFGTSGFYQQYLSVMLIVLSFTIGAFLRGGPTAPPTAVPEKPVDEAASRPQRFVSEKLSDLTYDNLFLDARSELDTDTAGAIADFLRNHDVTAEVELYAKPDGEEQTAGGPISLALARAVTLSHYFERADVPQQAIAVYAVEAQNDLQARVRLFRMRRAHE